MNHRAIQRELEAELAQTFALISELVEALKHAQEALFWHEGMDFEMDGRKAGHAIADALASASRHEARK